MYSVLRPRLRCVNPWPSMCPQPLLHTGTKAFNILMRETIDEKSRPTMEFWLALWGFSSPGPVRSTDRPLDRTDGPDDIICGGEGRSSGRTDQKGQEEVGTADRPVGVIRRG